MKKSIFMALLLAVCGFLSAQTSPVVWNFSSKSVGKDLYELTCTATIGEGWYIYSQHLESDNGPIPTGFAFQPGTQYEIVGKVEETGEIVRTFDEMFQMNIAKFKHQAIFTQKVRIKDKSKPVSGYVTFMSCNSEICLPPKDVDFSFSIK